MLNEISPALEEKFTAAKTVSTVLAQATTEQKNAGLRAIATAIIEHKNRILAANESDLLNGRNSGLHAGLLDRLRLDSVRLHGLAAAVTHITSLTDPVGQAVRGSKLPNGVTIAQVRVPFGVVGAIYEARPNVTIDIAALCLKSGNAAILRGGSAAEHTNHILISIMREALVSIGLPADSVQTIDEFGRPGAQQLMQARDYVDVLIPRGSASLIQTVVAESTVPVIETGDGVVHVFLDETAHDDWAVDIVHNAKVQRPSVCNALETLLIHKDAAERLVVPVLGRLRESGVTLHVDDRIRALFPDAIPAITDDWSAEYYSLDLAVAMVDSLDHALEHIRHYSTRHTESIVTNDLHNAERFLNEVDSAVVMVNTSPRFTDGAEFGFGAEVGISTQKLHARGPMGLAELTSTKWVVRGNGQVRR
jgi:glutamate-5-semialdehyde dehydrogenase